MAPPEAAVAVAVIDILAFILTYSGRIIYFNPTARWEYVRINISFYWIITYMIL